MKYTEIITRLKSMRNPENIAGMARYGIKPKNALGISAPTLKAIAKEIGKDHAMAERLWKSGIRESRIIAALIDDPKLVTGDQMERWVLDFDSWDVCDTCCMYLFDKTAYAYSKAIEWSEREEEFVKRAAFALMAALAIHDKKADDEMFEMFLPVIKREATDERNFVKKAINWALRQIGKRNQTLNRVAIDTGQEIRRIDSRAARWIAADALRELTGEQVQQRLRAKSSR
jgi:3-methyladenine DNA glycosylase AlkD